ncbi:uncharacterized protein LOC125064343 [Vanessa atalanta]|uniref:uncharacterized protein LOC125064343 n=1 Tax=Vanessa atalanta TaxID=42275 RepID=UPI001FCCFB0A|nr:uncharacterized protein LOC125064343 [Vanessa atalanta]
MTFKMIYFVGLILLANSLSCFPNRTPKKESSCNWPYITRCLTNFKPIFDFKPYFPVLGLNLNKDNDNKQMNRMPFSFPVIKENERSDFSNNEKQDSLHVNADQSSKNISEDKIYKVTTTNPKSKNIIDNDFIVFNTETSTGSEINTEYTTYYENDNTITTTEEQDVTTEELSFRLSDLPPAVIASFLG